MHTLRYASSLGCAAICAFALLQAQPRQPLCDPGNGGITLPSGFCAAVVADNLGTPRHMAITPRDADGDGRFEQQERFGSGLTGTAIAFRDPYLYVGANTKIVRYRLGDTLVPRGEPETIIDGFNPDRQHNSKPFAFGPNGELFVHVGPPSNACQNPDRKP